MTPEPGAPHRQTRKLLWIGFGGLVMLMCLFGASSLSFLYQIEIRHERMRQDYVSRDRMLEKLRSSIFLSGTYFRDFILDDDEARAFNRRIRFLNEQSEIESELHDYQHILRVPEQKPFQQLRTELATYFDVLTPALQWNAQQRRAQGYALVQDELLPRRMMALGFANRVQEVSEKQLEANSEAVSEMFSSFRARLLGLLVVALAIGIALAAGTMWRLLHLENASELSFREILLARQELKQLSTELLSAQESERRRISRELHDEVGQVLSAMMLGAGNIRSSILDRDQEGALRQLDLIENMTERSARVVRNISLLLRPTMLDDLGLVAALKWLAREVSRTTSVHAEITAEDSPDELPEEHRTCVFRVVQEALRNTSRHSGGHHVRVSVEVRNGLLQVSVQDDGKGFDPAVEKGMGILGMEERVVSLGGTFRVNSSQGRGATISFELPVPDPMRAPAPDHETNPLRTA